ncbi:MAG: methylenetetrahydrofolate--tRNA-(uracil(54)-C(5))-methyltransferase (FADH(2)-oxidizing) TrmFO [Chloroflexota bacterium]
MVKSNPVMNRPNLIVIGGGLAGSEAAWQAAERGLNVTLFEMRPKKSTEAHQTSCLAELVCSNSLGSTLPDRASGILMNELHRLGSILLECAKETALPAGSALAVDRNAFAEMVTGRISDHPHIEIIRTEITEIPEAPTIVASGPLTSENLSKSISQMTGETNLFFFDAIAPIVIRESINMDIAFRASRYGKGDREDGDYINCPLDQGEYYTLIDELLSADRVALRGFESTLELGVNAGAHRFFEGCLPIETLARRGKDALAFGPMRPVGLKDPRTGNRPYAVVQLRQDNLHGSLYNIVGFQTNLAYHEQKRVLRLIPGLEKAEFYRFGQMHRNTFIASPKLLLPSLQLRSRPDLFLAGQITGVEGYLGNIATGLLAGWNAARLITGKSPIVLPLSTMLGALCHYITNADLADFQPMKANLGILPKLESEKRLNRRERAKAHAERALTALIEFIDSLD